MHKIKNRILIPLALMFQNIHRKNKEIVEGSLEELEKKEQNELQRL